MGQLMRIQIEPHSDLRAASRSLYRGGRRIDIIEIVDQWYGPGHRYVKVRGHDNSLYILRFDEICDHWELIMFCAAPAQGWQRNCHDLARSAESRQ
jgi:nicotinic acid mononucleotide adenylyltransferase